MAKPRTKPQREADRMYITQLYLQGCTQAEIAHKLNDRGIDRSVTQQTVSNDLKKIRKLWAENTTIDFDALLQKDLDKIDHLERVYWQQFENSMANQVRTTKKSKGTAQLDPSIDPEADDQEPIDPAADVETTVQIIENATGNPEFLRGIERCIKLRNELLGRVKPADNVFNTSMTLNSQVNNNTTVNKNGVTLTREMLEDMPTETLLMLEAIAKGDHIQ